MSPSAGPVVLVLVVLGMASLAAATHQSVEAGEWAYQPTPQTGGLDPQWRSVAWSESLDLAVAVAVDASNSYIMTSQDGDTWTPQFTATANARHYAIEWSPQLALFVIVGLGVGTETSTVFTSPDGETWTPRTAASTNNWRALAWSPELGLFAAVSDSGTGNRVMTSPDGITWTSRTSAADNPWQDVVWASGLGLFVAVANAGTNTQRSMHSSDGETWTLGTTPNINHPWVSVAYSPELNRVIASRSTAGGSMYSNDGSTWTNILWPNTVEFNNGAYRGAVWSPEAQLFGLFRSSTSNTCSGGHCSAVVLVSADGVDWAYPAGAQAQELPGAGNPSMAWADSVWAPSLAKFIAVASGDSPTNSGQRVLTGTFENLVPEPPPPEPDEGTIFGENGAIWGGNKTAFAELLQINVTALETTYAMLWILLFAAAGFVAFRTGTAAALGAGAGVVWSIAFGLISLWLVAFLAVTGAAAFVLVQRRGSAA